MLSSFACSLLFLAVGVQRQDPPIQIVRDAKFWEWTRWNWTVENNNVNSLIKKVDALALQGKGSAGEIERLAMAAKKQYESTPKPDAHLLVMWAYASRVAKTLDKTSASRTRFSIACTDLEKVPPVASYAYARTRYLAISDWARDRYIPLGYRLLKKNPNDYPVKFALVYLVYTVNPTDAKKLSSELLRDFPEKAILLAMRGDVYDTAYAHGRNKKDLEEAKRYYELFLHRVPSDPYAPVVKMRLKRVTRMLGDL